VCLHQTVFVSRTLCYPNVDHENHFLMNAPEVSEQQLSKHDRQDGVRAIECTTEINDSRARIEEDRADLFTPYWIYLQNSACHRSLSIIATPIPLFHRTKFPQARVRCGQNRQLFRGSVFQSLSLSSSLVELLSIWSSVQNQRFSTKVKMTLFNIFSVFLLKTQLISNQHFIIYGFFNQFKIFIFLQPMLLFVIYT